MTRQKSGRGAAPTTRALLAAVDYNAKQREALKLGKELKTTVIATNSGTFRVLGGYTATDAAGVRRLVARLKVKPVTQCLCGDTIACHGSKHLKHCPLYKSET